MSRCEAEGILTSLANLPYAHLSEPAPSRQVLEELHSQGKARAIGVSNFEVSHLQQLLAAAHVPPAANQFELHPRRPAAALRGACGAGGVGVIAYASLGCGALLREPVVQAVAAEAGRSAAQVLLGWGLQSGAAVIPKSVSPARIAEFAPDALLSWELSGQQMAALDGLADGHKFCWDPTGIV